MHKIVEREITDTVKARLKNYPAVALLGARQVGKSTLAGIVIEQIPKAIHLDLERPSDLN
jgi:predicted AAA+ superfamily ATPase